MGLFDSEPHTDLTDPTGFLCGWEISRRFVGLIDFGPNTDLTDPTGCLCGWEISRISVNEDGGMLFYFLLYNFYFIIYY